MAAGDFQQVYYLSNSIGIWVSCTHKSGLIHAEGGLAAQEASWLFCSGVRAVMNSS